MAHRNSGTRHAQLRLVVTSFVMAINFGDAVCGADEAKTELIQPDQAVQDLVRRILVPSIRRDSILVQELKDIAAKDRYGMVEQLMYYSLHSDRRDFEGRMAVGLSRWLDIEDSWVLSVAVKHMGSTDKEMRELTRFILYGLEDPYRRPDYELHQLKIAGDLLKGTEPSPELIHYLVACRGGAGLLAVTRAHHGQLAFEKGIIWGERVIENYFWKKRNEFPVSDTDIHDTVEQLKLLAKHRQWWVRLYVACVMQRNMELRHAETFNALQNDGNEQVRRAAVDLPEHNCDINKYSIFK